MAIMDPPSTLRPAEVAEAMVQHGIAKHRTRWDMVFWKAFLAGIMLSFGGILSTVISGGSTGLNTSNPGLVKVMGGFVFPVGLVMIVLQGLELLTSNMMIFPMAIIKRQIPWWSLPLNWFIVTFGNLTGSLFFAEVLVKQTGIVSSQPYIAYIQSFAIRKVIEPHWYQIFLRGIACNWLVCIAVWQAAGARETLSKIISIWIPIWIFVSCGYDHVVANMFSVPLGIMFHAEGLTTAMYIRKSLIAAYLGNIVGALFMALPATYFYLSDYDTGGMRGVEEGEGFNGPADSQENKSDNNTVSDKRME
ncbi:Formate/nitrite transporter [Neolentinus lepideus HHB14362 ss-1]|uniref:Formate/nitrite transporter n=1 Tax=Neolentinus lepideus HHB14362 ss-1 TaxID=1314782 RepID=A0A165RT93_9AGAM|nr:Formate/nitrite transporter [Neolentinus lepideus HHB14362 ss-1]